MITHYPSPLTNGLLSDIDRFVNHAFGTASDEVSESCESDPSCPTQIEATTSDTDGWKLRLALPGFLREEVKISADADFLHITAKTEDEARDFLSTQERRVRISDEVDTSGIKARLENGLLFIEIPRRVKEQPVDIVID